MAGTTDDDWLDDLLLEEDPKSARMWKRDSIGMNKPEAMKGVPRFGQATCRVSIVLWRRMKQHTDSLDTNIGTFFRRAIGEKMLRDGVPASEIEGWLK